MVSPPQKHQLKNYVDNTGIQKLLPLLDGSRKRISARAIDASTWGILDIALLSDAVLLNNFVPNDISTISDDVINKMVESCRINDIPFAVSNIPTYAQKQMAFGAAHDTVMMVHSAFVKTPKATQRTLSQHIPVIGRLEAEAYDLKPRNAGNAAWDQFWKLLDTNNEDRISLAEELLSDMASGFLFFWCLINEEDLLEKIFEMRVFIEELSSFEQDIIQTIFFVYLNHRISVPIQANYASTRARQILSDNARTSFVETYSNVIRRVIDKSLVHKPDCQEYSHFGYGGSIGLSRLVFKGRDDSIPFGDLISRLAELKHDFRVQDLIKRIRQIDNLARNGAEDKAVAEMNFEAVNVEKALFDGLGLSRPYGL